MIRLMACPFCGAEAPLVMIEIDISDPMLNDPGRVCHVKCALCGARGANFNVKEYSSNFEELASEAWNTRAGTD